MITARDYQINAINKFRNNQWRGILEMATGTGKTITSLLIANEYKNINKGIFLIILVPFLYSKDTSSKVISGLIKYSCLVVRARPTQALAGVSAVAVDVHVFPLKLCFVLQFAFGCLVAQGDDAQHAELFGQSQYAPDHEFGRGSVGKAAPAHLYPA